MGACGRRRARVMMAGAGAKRGSGACALVGGGGARARVSRQSWTVFRVEVRGGCAYQVHMELEVELWCMEVVTSEAVFAGE